MLLQSHLGSPDNRIADLLPALPDDWKNGSVKGLRARGNFIFDITWENSTLKTAKVTAEENSTLKIKLNDKTKNLKANKQFTIEDNVLTVNLSKGETTELINLKFLQ
jgi:alpha-L-fucosidase 2